LVGKQSDNTLWNNDFSDLLQKQIDTTPEIVVVEEEPVVERVLGLAEPVEGDE